MSSVKIFVLLVAIILLNSVESRDSRRGGKPSATTYGDIFLKGNYMEVAINPSGGLGSRQTLSGRTYGGTATPAGYHNLTNGRLGVVVDHDFNGWNVGSPPQSADAFIEGYDEVGWHLTWDGPSGHQIFNNMPMFNDDDDGEQSSYVPYRGCIPCQNGQRTDNCDSFEKDCSCNLGTTSNNYIDCPFKRWDIDTTSIQKVTDSVTLRQKVIYRGLAHAQVFTSNLTGTLVSTGEKVGIYKEITYGYNDTILFEHVTLTNLGNSTLTNVSIMWHIVPTPECFPNAGKWPSNPETDFNNYVSIPNQGNGVDDKVLIKSRGRLYNMTTSMGTLDRDARAWYETRNTWGASGENRFRRPYTTNWIYGEPKTTGTTEIFSEHVIVLATRIPILGVGQSVQKHMFWGFTEKQIETVGFTGLAIPVTTGTPTTAKLTTGSITSGYYFSQTCPSFGDCCSAHPLTSSCSNPCLSQCVCNTNLGGIPSCCSGAGWGSVCVNKLKELLAGGLCIPEIPGNGNCTATTCGTTCPDTTTGSYGSGSTTSPTSSKITSAEVTTSPLTSGEVTSSALTSGGITSHAVTSAQLTSADITSNAVTSSALTSGAITSHEMTSAPVTSAHVTSAALTTSPLTSAALTSAPVTSAHVTSQAVTSSPLTTSPVTSAALTSAELTSAAVTSAHVTSASLTTSPVTSAALTSAALTSAALTSSALTSAALTSAALTSAALTSAALTSAALTSNGVTTSPITTSPVTSAVLTTSPLTSGGVTTHSVTTSPLTSARLTTAVLTTSPLTTHAVTTGSFGTGSTTGVEYGTGSTTGINYGTGSTTGINYGTGSTTGINYGTGSTTGIEYGTGSTTGTGSTIGIDYGTGSTTGTIGNQQTTGQLDGGSVIDSSIDDVSDEGLNDRNKKIIASVFGVAGFILIVLCVGGIILAVKRIQSDPVV